MLSIRLKEYKFKTISLLCLLLCLFAILPQKFYILFTIWLIGAMTSFIPTKVIKNRLFYFILFISLIIISRLYNLEIKKAEIFINLKNYFIAISFALFLSSMRHINSSLLIRLRKFNSIMAGFSFSLYLLHFPMMLFILSYFFCIQKIQAIRYGFEPMNPVGIFLYLLIILMVLVFSWLFSKITENNTKKIKMFLLK